MSDVITAFNTGAGVANASSDLRYLVIGMTITTFLLVAAYIVVYLIPALKDNQISIKQVLVFVVRIGFMYSILLYFLL